LVIISLLFNPFGDNVIELNPINGHLKIQLDNNRLLFYIYTIGNVDMHPKADRGGGSELGNTYLLEEYPARCSGNLI
jgi:hypothetical protein